jgi:phosphate transport system protein
MHTDSLGNHISSRFNADLERVRGSVLTMGGLVEQQLQRALGGFVDANTRVIVTVAQEELKVNELERSIDEDCSRILATRNPAASDLRLIIAILKAIADLERIGDEAEKIATIASRLAQREHGSAQYHELRHLGRLVQTLVTDALDVLARLDSDQAFAVMRRDRQVDEEYEAIQRQSITFMMEDPRFIRRTLDVMWVVRSLERVGDHAKNICEYVIYAVHGKDVRHLRIDDAERELRHTGNAGTEPQVL